MRFVALLSLPLILLAACSRECITETQATQLMQDGSALETAGKPQAAMSMLQDQAQECHAAERAGFHLAGFAVLVAERDVAIAVCNDILLGQYPAIQIPSQIHQCLLPRTHRFAIHHPFFWILPGQF